MTESIRISKKEYDELVKFKALSEYVVISKEELDRLQRDSTLLDCIEDAGVDNWAGMAEAYEVFLEYYPKED